MAESKNKRSLYVIPLFTYSQITYTKKFDIPLNEVIRHIVNSQISRVRNNWDELVEDCETINQSDVKLIATAVKTFRYYPETDKEVETEDKGLVFYKKWKTGITYPVEEKRGDSAFKEDGVRGAWIFGGITGLLIVMLIGDKGNPLSNIVNSFSLLQNIAILGILIILNILLGVKLSPRFANIVDKFDFYQKFAARSKKLGSENPIVEIVTRGFWVVEMVGEDKVDAIEITMSHLEDLKNDNSVFLANAKDYNGFYSNINLKGIYLLDPETRRRITVNMLPFNKRKLFGLVSFRFLFAYILVVYSVLVIF